MVPEAGLEPARGCPRGSFESNCRRFGKQLAGKGVCRIPRSEQLPAPKPVHSVSDYFGFSCLF